MTATELQRIALRLSNQGWTRHWLHWNYPVRNPWVMAIQVRDHNGKSVHVLPLDARGFAWDEVNEIHVINRQEDDGTPYGSPL